MQPFHIYLNKPAIPFPHPWAVCVGSCHAPTALRADWREHLTRAHQDLGFQYVRFHGLLDDSMSVCIRNRAGELVYHFGLIDNVFDFLLSIGMKPFVELSFMPTALASTDKTVFVYRGNVSLPTSYDLWADLIRRLVTHVTERYGEEEVATWFFEVWNEPNLAFFYEGTQADYFELYDHTARTIKAVSEKYRVGGPATAINAWVPEMIQHCRAAGVPLDFISTHHYPTDDPLWNTGMTVEAYFAALAQGDAELVEKARVHRRGVLTTMLEQTRKEAEDYPLYYTEWNTSADSADLRHDVPYSASFVVKTLIDNGDLADIYSFWTFTDIFEEGGQHPGEFHGGFGLQTVHGIRKPVYHAFQMLHQLGNTRWETTPEQGTVGLVSSRVGGKLLILAYNHDVPDHPPAEQHVTIQLEGDHPYTCCTVTRVDDTHANPYACYQAQGCPEYPTADQLDQMQAASQTHPETLPFTGNTLQLTLPPHGIALLALE